MVLSSTRQGKCMLTATHKALMQLKAVRCTSNVSEISNTRLGSGADRLQTLSNRRHRPTNSNSCSSCYHGLLMITLISRSVRTILLRHPSISLFLRLPYYFEQPVALNRRWSAPSSNKIRNRCSASLHHGCVTLRDAARPDACDFDMIPRSFFRGKDICIPISLLRSRWLLLER